MMEGQESVFLFVFFIDRGTCIPPSIVFANINSYPRGLLCMSRGFTSAPILLTHPTYYDKSKKLKAPPRFYDIATLTDSL